MDKNRTLHTRFTIESPIAETFTVFDDYKEEKENIVRKGEYTVMMKKSFAN